MNHHVEALFEQQMRQWPQLRRGLEGLTQAETRRLRVKGFDVFVRHIPHRVASTTAAVDAESIAARPCFLCAKNLPHEEKGLPFDDEFTIYCNPFPIVSRHLTISHREHCPQRIARHFRKMLDLTSKLPGYFVIYNGPECGASAPDHMHFQAGSRELFPIETDAVRLTGLTIRGYARNVFVFRSTDRSAIIAGVERAIDVLEEITGRQPEPMVNIAVFYEAGEWVTYVFPRGKHRPSCFHSGELTVSPASIDLCGIIAVPKRADFEKITADAIVDIFREVTLPDAQFEEAAAWLEARA
jgi:ATP adenylyltransferase/5',5'''-P-1,P-4-tetraphosphate phosphorylase II